MKGTHLYTPAVLGLFTMFLAVSGARLASDDRVLTICMDGKHHETKPAARELYGLCKQWESNTCCNNKTTYHLQQAFSNLYNFNLHHCREMSHDCMEWFNLNNCFYECSPNVGPWLRPVKSSYRNEKFMNVPLCANQCQSWWDACKNEMTCVDNWSTDFVWHNGSNQCPKDKPCKNFTEIFHNATNFCETVYPGDFLVSENESSCMQLNFTGPNPNADVARKYAEKNNMSLEIVTTTTQAPTTGRAPVTQKLTPTSPTPKPPTATTATSHGPTSINATQAGVVISSLAPPGTRSSTIIAAVVGVVITVVLILVLIVCKIRTSEEGIKCIPCFAWFSQGSTAATHFRVPTDEQAFLDPDAEDDISPHGELELTL